VQKTICQTARIGGTKTTGDTITVTVYDPGLSGGQEAVTYTVQSGDTLASIASGLAAAITADTNLQTLGVNAVSTSTLLTIQSASKSVTTYASSLSGGATEAVTLGAILNGTENAVIGGTKTTGDTLTITVHDSGLSGGQESVNYTVGSSDTLTTIASALAAAINADTNLQGIGVAATSASTVVSIKSTSTNATTYTESVSTGATETISLSVNTNGIQTAAIGGSKTTGNTLTVTVYDSGLSAGSEAVTYTVLSGDTLTSIASGLASAINADSNLQAIGVSATSVSTVVNLKSVSINNTTYVSSTSGGATETITLGLSTGIQQYTYNNVNELTGIAAGGAARFQGSTNKAVKSATINSTVPATLNWSENFTGNAVLSTGLNNATVSAVDGANNTVTNPYKISVNSGSSSSLTYDSNGNMTSDGTNSYAWDAENRLIKITYPGSGNYSSFTYDALGHWASIVETASGSVTSTKQFVWANGVSPLEARNSSSTITAQYFSLGQTISGTSYYYFKDHVPSICGTTNSAGTIQAQYAYDPYGQVTKIAGSGPDSDFQYAGYYYHSRSGLNLTLNRAYNASFGRWINRDPIEEAGGINLYSYANNEPVQNSDPSGLAWAITPCKFKPPTTGQWYGNPRLYSKPISSFNYPFIPIRPQHTSIFTPPWNSYGPPIDLSAGPSGNPPMLVPFNQTSPDYTQQQKNNNYIPLPPPPGVSSAAWSNALQAAANTYVQPVPYNLTGNAGYNSNSYTAGVINAAANSLGVSDYSVAPPKGNFLTPGFSNPLPLP
jgi:RHS repeat-associated protein